jgi:uncharacterized protein (TIGR00369 family)
MQTPNPNYRHTVEQCFLEAAFIGDIGMRLIDCGPGWAESVIALKPRHLQHTGVVHAGVQTTMADHTGGCAAMTLAGAEDTVLTVEFKMHLLRAGKGESLWCRAQVLKPGSKFSIVESEVHAVSDGRKTLVSKLIGTMAILPRQ